MYMYMSSQLAWWSRVPLKVSIATTSVMTCSSAPVGMVEQSSIKSFHSDYECNDMFYF